MEKNLKIKIGVILAVLGICAYFAFPLDKRINLGLDLQGGMHLLMKIDTSKLSAKAKGDAAERAIEVLRNRIDQFGVREASILAQGEDEVVVQLPGVTDRERAIELIGKTALLEFKLVSNDPEKLKAAREGKVPDGYELRSSEESGEQLLLEKEALLTGDALKTADVRFSQAEFNAPVVSLEFNPKGAEVFGKITADNIGRRLAIVLDGKVQSAPNIKDAIPNGEAVISGSFTIDKAQDLALVLRVGALPAPMHIEEERTVGPVLGRDSIDKGVRACAFGCLFVVLTMALYYLLPGLISDFALLGNFLMIVGCLGLLPVLFPGVSATLTLPGIAGIALSLGMAIDANVLINERIREEMALGKNLKVAVVHGYDRAFSAIFDSHITNLIAAFFLFQFGTGPIRGFAVTLTIGLITSLFTSIVVTRTIFELLLHFKLIKSVSMLHLIRETKFDFIGKRRFFFALSTIVIIAGLWVFFSKGTKAYGIDFSGGTLEEYSFKDPVHIDKVRDILKDMKVGSDAVIQQFAENPRVVLIRMMEDKHDLLTKKLKETFPNEDIQILRVERVGPVAGKHLKAIAIKSLFFSLIGILIWIIIRFKHMNFAVAGVASLVHDVVVALGAMALTGRPIDLLTITALLTIAGYSINDTIVIYDRVRENMKLNPKAKLHDVLNKTVNQMLGRTIITTGLTLLTVVAIFIFGGEVLHNFAFCLMIGFVCGVYSTVYIAAPLVLAWTPKQQR